MNANNTSTQLGLIYGAISIFILSAVGLFSLLVSRTALTKLPFTCPFKALTHIPCLTCGGTRSVLYLSQFSLIDSFLINPLVFLTAVGCIIWGILSLISLLNKNQQSFIPPLRVNIIGIISILVLNWLYLILVAHP